VNGGGLLVKLDRHREALGHLDEGITQAERLRRSDPNNPLITPRLVLGLALRARARTRLGRIRDADADWERALEIAPAAQHLRVRVQRADSRARAGDYRRSAGEAEELARVPRPVSTLLDLAVVQALNAASVRRDSTRPLPERARRAGQYAAQAVALLKRAATTGIFRTPAVVAFLDRLSELDFLRDRDDYKQFRAGLGTSK
jgi:tetratricopeptide (TPR) repeat protein